MRRRSEPILDPVTDGMLTMLRERIELAVGEALMPGDPVALVNFPNHANAGDPAVWLGEEAVLARLGVPVVHRASWESFDERALRSALPEGTVLVNGGGNFGDVYGNQESVRERVLEALRDHRVVQMPQSIWFRETANLERMRRLVEGHGSVTLLLRDDESFELAQELFAVPCRLCPDIALALEPRRRPLDPEVPILWLARRDQESTGYRPPEAEDVRVVDWLGPVGGEPSPGPRVRMLLAANRRLVGRSRANPGRRSGCDRLLTRTFAPLARYWVDRGCRILAEGQVVVTDRLHGHVLALLMGMPHVLVDNANGKLGALHRTWTCASPLVRLAEGPAEALAMARELVGDARSPRTGPRSARLDGCPG